MKQSPYEVLQIEPNSSAKDIKKQYKRMVRKYPPEQYPEKFMDISNAYEFFTKVTDKPISSFPLYRNQIEEDTAQTEKKEDIRSHLSTYFETPYSTIFEIKQLLTEQK